MSLSRRQFKRYVKRVEVQYKVGQEMGRGISSNVSEQGIFIRTRKGLIPGLELDIVLYLPDGSTSNVKGVVRRTIRTGSRLVKDGMGVQITEPDDKFRRFVGDFEGDYLFIFCLSCGSKNRIPTDKVSLGPKCGVCKTSLERN